MRIQLPLAALFVVVLCFMHVGMSKLDIWPPETVVLAPKADAKYVATDRRVTMWIRATISDDRAIRRISVTLWGTTKTGTFEQTETLYSVEFDQPNTKTVHIDKTTNAGIGDFFVLPGHYYVRFVVEDFVGNKRVVWVEIYVEVCT